MADIHIHREHRLGLAKARKIAWQWAEDVEEKFGMECTVIEGKTSDVVEFTRARRRRPADRRRRLVRPDGAGSASCSAPSAAGSRPRSRRTSTRCSPQRQAAAKKKPAAKAAAKKK